MSAKGFDAPALFDKRDRAAVITGGSGHFGRAMALALARAGARVAILGRHLAAAQTVARAIEAEGGTALACDVMSRASLEQSQEHVLSAFRPLTRVPAYGAAKAAVANFTQWLAVHMAQEYSPAIRVKTHPRI